MIAQKAAVAAILSVGVTGLRRKTSQRTNLATCGMKGGDDSSFKPMIVNGRDADACEWRWQVGLRSSGDTDPVPWCGGMLIDPEWVLTAAHCVEDETSVDIVAGEHTISNATGREQVRASAKIIVHPHYARHNNDYDFALVRLANPVTVDDCVGTVCLPSEGEEVPPGTKCWITGWGTLKSNGEQPDILQEAEVATLSNRDCHSQFEYSFKAIDDSMLCAQGINDRGEVTDACQGDSGGPLVCETAPGRWTLHGATSWGYGCADRSAPGIWARVERAVGWIKEVRAGNGDFVPATPAPPSCPDIALLSAPDGNGDCICPPHKYCSRDGGASRDCPKFDTSVPAWVPIANQLFEFDCADCECYNTFSWFR